MKVIFILFIEFNGFKLSSKMQNNKIKIRTSQTKSIEKRKTTNKKRKIRRCKKRKISFRQNFKLIPK